MVNLFWTSENIDQSVKWLVDPHVGSCVYEGSIICMHAAKHRGYETDLDLWTHHIAHHPCIDYAAAHPLNWLRSYAYVERAHQEWHLRGDHDDDHGALEHLRSAISIEDLLTSVDWPDDSPKVPPKVTGTDMWRGEGYYSTDISLTESYRYYYANVKDHLHEWSAPRSEPEWLEEYKTEKSPAEKLEELKHHDIRNPA